MLGGCGQFGQSGLARLQSVPQCWYLELVSVASKGYMILVKLMIIFYEKILNSEGLVVSLVCLVRSGKAVSFRTCLRASKLVGWELWSVWSVWSGKAMSFRVCMSVDIFESWHLWLALALWIISAIEIFKKNILKC